MKESIEELFRLAKEQDEFEFICTLINFKGLGSKNSTSNLNEWFLAIDYYQSLFKPEADKYNKVRIGLLIYSTFFESSDLYNVLGSLARIIQGYRSTPYLYYKHETADRWYGTSEKISRVTEILNDVNCSDIVDFFKENHYKEIRNTFFHSSYSLDDNNYVMHDSEPMFVNNIGMTNVSITRFLFPKIYAVIEFFNKFKYEFQTHYSSYLNDKVVVGRFPKEVEITILGSESGLKGFKSDSSYIMLKSDFWIGMNIRLDSPSEVDRYINEELERYLKKETIQSNDGKLIHLEEVINNRNRPTEKKALAIVYGRFAEKIKDKTFAENNPFKKIDLAKKALSFFQRMIINDSTKEINNSFACIKFFVASHANNNILVIESFNDMVFLLEKEPSKPVLDNALHILEYLKGAKEDITNLKSKIKSTLKRITVPDLLKEIENAKTKVDQL